MINYSHRLRRLVIMLSVVPSCWGYLSTSWKHHRAPFRFHPPSLDHTGGGQQQRFMSSYSMDGSEYSSKDGDFETDEDGKRVDFNRDEEYREGENDVPTEELTPVPMSKNAGNRFVACVWDKDLDNQGRDSIQLHEDRIALTEDHVMFCRKANLYNETFNTESMVDVLWSRQMLATDLQRTVGHAFCMESSKLEDVHELLRREPIVRMTTGGDLSNIPLYRWRHIRDYSLRQDDGRFGYPAALVALDDEDVGELRKETEKKTLEYLIRSARVIAAGPLHVPTQEKDDPSSSPVGDFIMFNAKDREAAIEFAEGLPSAEAGLYKSMRVHFYNNLDVTGKFVSEDPGRDSPGEQMQEALHIWGYPAGDDQTPWLNS